MDLQGNNEFTALFRGYIRAAGVLLFAVSCVRESVKCWGGWLHGSRKVTGSGAAGWPQPCQPDCGVDCALANRSQADHSPEVSYSPAVSVTILILDGLRTVPGQHHRARISSVGRFYFWWNVKEMNSRLCCDGRSEKRRNMLHLKYEVRWNYQRNKHLIAPLPNFDVWLAYQNMFASFFKQPLLLIRIVTHWEWQDKGDTTRGYWVINVSVSDHWGLMARRILLGWGH